MPVQLVSVNFVFTAPFRRSCSRIGPLMLCGQRRLASAVSLPRPQFGCRGFFSPFCVRDVPFIFADGAPPLAVSARASPSGVCGQRKLVSAVFSRFGTSFLRERQLFRVLAQRDECLPFRFRIDFRFRCWHLVCAVLL